MKKTLVSAILGLAAIASVQAQGVVTLYNYGVSHINYGVVNAGGAIGTGIVDPDTVSGNWNVGLYYALASTTSASAANAAMTGDGGFGLIPLLTLGTGVAVLNGTPGEFGPLSSGAMTGVAGGANATVVIVAWQGAGNYNAASVRGHSAAFTIQAVVAPSTPNDVGPLMGSFNVYAVPEPSTFALAGLGLAGLLIFRRRN